MSKASWLPVPPLTLMATAMDAPMHIAFLFEFVGCLGGKVPTLHVEALIADPHSCLVVCGMVCRAATAEVLVLIELFAPGMQH